VIRAALLLLALGLVAGCGADGAPIAPGESAPKGLFAGQ